MLPSIKNFFLLVILIFCNYFFVNGQIDFSKYKIGVSGGYFVYQGDLTPQKLGSFKTLKSQFAIHVYRVLTDAFSIRFNVTHGSLYGNDAAYSLPTWRRNRNFTFTTPITEFSIHGVRSFLQNTNSSFLPYVFAGVGLSIVNIKSDWSNLNTTVFPEGSDVQAGLVLDAAKKLPKVIPVLPVGAGVTYFIDNHFSLLAEVNYRLMHTDYLDGFSQSANPNSKDHYFSTSMGLIYSFDKARNKNLKCPKKITK